MLCEIWSYCCPNLILLAKYYSNYKDYSGSLQNCMYIRNVRLASETSTGSNANKSSYSAYTTCNIIEWFVVRIRFFREHIGAGCFYPIPLQVSCSELAGDLCWQTASARRWNVLHLCNERIRTSEQAGKDQSSCSEQSPSLIEPEEAEDPVSCMHNGILLLQPGGVWIGRAIRKQSKTHRYKRFHQARRESPLREGLQTRII